MIALWEEEACGLVAAAPVPGPTGGGEGGMIALWEEEACGLVAAAVPALLGL